MIIGIGAFEMCLDHEDGDLMNGMNDLVTERFFAPSTMLEHRGKVPSVKPESGLHQTLNLLVFDLGLPSL